MAKKQKDVTIRNFTPKVFFADYFKERKVLEYLKNLINSHLLVRNPFESFDLACSVVGQKNVIRLVEKYFPNIKKEPLYGRMNLNEYVPDRVIISLLKNDVTYLITKRLNQLACRNGSELEKRLSIVKSTFKLSTAELDVLTLCYLIEGSTVLEEYFRSNRILDLLNVYTFRNYGYTILGMTKAEVSKVFYDRKIFDTNILDIGHSYNIRISAWCTAYLSCIGKRDLTHGFFTKENDVLLTISDFDLPQEDLMVLDTLLDSKSGHNILFYGEPGTGKTSLAKCLAKTYSKGLFSVKIPENDEHADRLTAVYATLSMADRDNDLVVIDEADEILNTYSSIFFSSKTNKCWINSLLDTHGKKAIWITNRIDGIHSATMRRFSFSREFKNFSEKNRLRVMMKELRGKGILNIFSGEEITELCRTYSVNAGGIIGAIDILDINKKTDKESALRKIKAVLRSHEKITSGKAGGLKKMKDFKNYTIRGLNCSEDIDRIISAVKRYSEPQERESLKCNQSLSLLLYGMPGTGKSEFVYYLGHLLGKEVILKRCSEIHSMWVGATEKNIAAAFEEAQLSESILLFDEADSFLFPRNLARHSWEKDFTNEILTQLESFIGIVAFATNDIDGLDHAALRRFKFKVEFRPLTSDGKLHFYNTILKPLVAEDIAFLPEYERAIREIKNLTPGDFAIARDQLLFEDRSSITHQRLIELLANEVRYKQNVKQVIGF